MKLLRKYILYTTAILIALSCTHTNNELLKAEQLVETAPDSAIAILNKYTYNKLTDKDKALYGLILIQARDKKFLTLEPDSILDFSTNYYATNKKYTELAKCYFFKGKLLKNKQNYSKAVEFFYTLTIFYKNQQIMNY